MEKIIIRGGKTLHGGEVDSCGDHRIVMMAACTAVISDAPVVIKHAEAVRKSYPHFFEDISKLGLKAEIH
jgi:3-phosphoshikimate 1-carboxyvinyltransferase